MKLPRLAVYNYNFTLVVFFILLIVGLMSFFNMPRTENPTIYMPGASVVVIYPGASPNDLEKLVAIPIEEAVNEIDDIDRVNTRIEDGIVAVMVRFDYGTDSKEKYDEVVSQVNNIKSNLPTQIFDIGTYRWTSSDVSILQLALVSDSMPYHEMDILADNLKRNIERSFGVKKVEIHALPEREVRVSIDMQKIAMMNIGLSQVMNSLQSYNANIPGGTIKLSDKYFNIKTSGSYENLGDIENTVIDVYKGKTIYLKNVADVCFKEEDQNYYARFRGRRAIFISAKQKADINIFKIMDGINPILDHFNEGLDDGAELHTVFDQSKNVDKRISTFLSNLIQGIILVGILILLAIGFKSALIIIIAIPLSILIGLSIVDFSGYGLQQISIAGLVIALGLLVDNSIVMIENIDRHLKMGYKPKEAAVMGASEIGWPIVSATLTTLLAFIPIIMMTNESGDFIRSLPVTIIATLSISLLIALTLSPLIASRFLKNKDFKQSKSKKHFDLNRFLEKFIQGPYRRTLQFSLRNKLLVIGISLIVFVFSIFIFMVAVPKSFFPKAETPQFLIRVNMPEGTNLDKTTKTTKWVESILDTIPDIKHYASNIGKGNPRIYYNVFQKNYTKTFSEIYVELFEFEVERFDNLVNRLRNIFSGYTGAEITVKELEQGSPVEAQIEINILGDDINVLQNISKDIEEFVGRSNRVINLENELDSKQTDLFFNINKDKASMLGVSIHEIDRTIRTAIAGWPATSFLDDMGNEYDIVLRMPFKEKVKLSDLDKVYVKSMAGRMIPLKQLAKIEFKEAPGIISRYNLERNARVLADIKKDANLDEVMEPILNYLKSYPFPNGYHYVIGGEQESREESFGGMKTALIIAVVSILAVLILQFNSFTQPLIIFVTVPLAMIGMVWALMITGNSFSFTAFVGLIALVGIVVNNSIILVDYANVLRKKGVILYDAVQQAGEIRFTPIILTAFTTIGGLLPLTLRGGTLWAPMGWTVIGGLFVSTALTLIIVPVLYSGLERTIEKVKVRKGDKRSK